MMSLGTIHAMSAEAARKAKSKNLRPYIVRNKNLSTPFPFPNFGDYRPKGWELVDTLFCDASGFGSEGEPALTVEQLRDRLQIGYGYALIEVGQFQAYVGEFKQVKSKEGLKG